MKHIPLLIGLITLLIAAGLIFSPANQAGAQSANAWPQISLVEIASGFNRPLHIAHAGDGSGRIFVVELAGLIKILKNGAIQGTFLDISDRVLAPVVQKLLNFAEATPLQHHLVQPRDVAEFLLAEQVRRIIRNPPHRSAFDRAQALLQGLFRSGRTQHPDAAALPGDGRRRRRPRVCRAARSTSAMIRMSAARRAASKRGAPSSPLKVHVRRAASRTP